MREAAIAFDRAIKSDPLIKRLEDELVKIHSFSTNRVVVVGYDSVEVVDLLSEEIECLANQIEELKKQHINNIKRQYKYVD